MNPSGFYVDPFYWDANICNFYKRTNIYKKKKEKINDIYTV